MFWGKYIKIINGGLTSNEGVLVSHDAQVDGGVAVLLNGGQQSGAIAVRTLESPKNSGSVNKSDYDSCCVCI